MSNGRPYKIKLSKAEIKAELRDCAGKQFDPQLAELFLAILEVEEEMAGL
jgi:response regulator RpfG family c-di-GMP phosphodiesterase